MSYCFVMRIFAAIIGFKAIKLFKHENKTFSINAGVWRNERLCPADRLS